MGRTAREPLQLPALSEQSGQIIQAAETARRVMDLQALAAGRLVQYAGVLEAVGRIKTAQFYASMSESLLAQTFSQIRREKSYLGLPYQDTDGRLQTTGDLEEFCHVFLGKSYRRLDELADNLHVLGPDLYEHAQQVGFRSKDYRALKALPANDQQAVREALEEGDKDLALTVLSQLVGRHQDARALAERQRQAAESDRAEIKADYDALASIHGEQAGELARLRQGDLPVPGLDVRMAGWAPQAQTLLEEMTERMLGLAQLAQAAARMEYPDGAQERAAWRKALTQISDVLGVGLARHSDMVQDLALAVERGITDKVYATDDDGAPLVGQTQMSE